MNESTLQRPNADTVLEHLAQFGIDGSGHVLNELFLKYFPDQKQDDLHYISRLMNTIRNEGLADVHINSFFGGSSHGVVQNLTNNKISATIKKAGIDHLRGGKINNSDNSVNIVNSAVNYMSPGAIASLNIGQQKIDEALSILKEMKEQISTSHDQSEETKAEVIAKLVEIETQVQDGKKPNDLAYFFIDVASKFATMGTFSINLLKILTGN